MIKHLRSLFRNLLQRDRVEQGLSEELQACLDILIQQRLAQGVRPDEARRQALIELGGIEPIREQVRAGRSSAFLESLARDLRFAMRRLQHAPGFTIVAVGTLALGIGLNTLMFSFSSAVLLKPLPFPNPERLVNVTMAPIDDAGARMSLTPGMYLMLRAHSTAFDAIGAYSGARQMNLGADSQLLPAERIGGHAMSAYALQALGLSPLLGRFHLPEEEVSTGVSNTILLGHAFWQRRFGGRSDVLGQSIVVEGRPTTIVGVMRPEFELFSGSKDAWVSFGIKQESRGTANWLQVVGRLKPGVSIEQATQETRAAATEYTAMFPERGSGWQITLEPLHESLFGEHRPQLLMLQAAAGFVLLISCANLAALLLSRVTSRARELAVRAALGQSRGGLLREGLVESLLLAVAGSAVGAFLAALAIRPLRLITPDVLPRLDAVAFDGRVFAYSLCLCVLTGIVFGLVPAWQASRPHLTQALADGGGRASGRPGRLLQLHGLVALQVAMAFVLLVGAGLMVGTFVRLLQVDVGVDTSGLLSFQVQLPRLQYRSEGVGRAEGGAVTLVDYYPSGPLMFDRIHEALKLLPGVESSAGSSTPPFADSDGVEFSVQGGETSGTVNYGSVAFVTANYFNTMRMHLVRGRDFAGTDQPGSPWVLVVNEAMAKDVWKDQDPLGQHLTFSYYTDDGERPREVIGVVADSRLSRSEGRPRPRMYALQRQQLVRQRASITAQRMQMSYVVRTTGDPMALAKPVQQLIARTESSIPVTEIRTVESYLDDKVETERFLTALLSVFGGIALLIGAVGIYGVGAHAVTQRFREFGIRRALGATGSSVLRLVLGRALIVIGLGTAVGLVASLLLTQFIAAYLWGVEPNDATTFVAIGSLLATTGIAASLVPALRAARVDPLTVLKHE